MPNSPSLPPTAELFNKRQLAERHPTFLSASRIEWSLRRRHKNGLAACGAVFETASGELLTHEPAFLAWFLGLSGRKRPRANRRAGS
ncbi:MAG: hypothetical protein ABI769_18110 [Pseudomonadota bacterium]